jgi:hypothetical protein
MATNRGPARLPFLLLMGHHFTWGLAGVNKKAPARLKMPGPDGDV